MSRKKASRKRKTQRKRGRKPKTWKGKGALIGNLAKTTKRGAKNLENLERRGKEEEKKTVENLFKTSLARKILGMVNVLRHILGAENPKYLEVKRRLKRDEKKLRKLGKVEKEELLKLEAYYAKLFWQVYFGHLCKRRGFKVEKRRKRYPLREKKDEVNRKLNIGGALLAKRFQRRYQFPLKGRFFHRKPIFDFIEFLRPFTYLIVYDTLEYGVKRLIRSLKRFFYCVGGYCDRLVLLCKFREKERPKGKNSSFSVVSLLFLSANSATNVDPYTYHHYYVARSFHILSYGRVPLALLSDYLFLSCGEVKELLYGMVFFLRVKDPFDLTRWITMVVVKKGRKKEFLSRWQVDSFRRDVVKSLVEREGGFVCLDDLCNRFHFSLEEASLLGKRLDKTWEFSYAVIDHPILLKKKLGIICKKNGLTHALKTLRNRVKTGAAVKNLRVVNSPPPKTEFVTAYDLWMQKIKRFEKENIPQEKT